MIKEIYLGFLALMISAYAIGYTETDVKAFKHAYGKFNELYNAGKEKEALEYAKQSYELGLKIYGDEHKSAATLAYNYGGLLLDLKHKKEAAKILDKTIDIFESVYGDDSQELVPVLMDLGKARAKIFRHSSTASHYKRALNIIKKHYGAESVEYAKYAMDSGVSLLFDSQSKRAVSYLDDSYKIFVKQLGDDSPMTGLAAFHLGKYELSTRDYEDAVEYLDKALKTFENPDKPSNVIEMATHGFLVKAYSKLDLQQQATKHCLAIGRMTPFTSTQDYQPLVRELPTYPRLASELGKEGYAIVEFDVDEQGFVKNIETVDWSGDKSFIATSEKAVKKFRYAPAFIDGEPVVTKGVQNKFIYELEK